jgi:hypothetical protein
MEVMRSYETSVYVLTTRRYIPEDGSICFAVRLTPVTVLCCVPVGNRSSPVFSGFAAGDRTMNVVPRSL